MPRQEISEALRTLHDLKIQTPNRTYPTHRVIVEINHYLFPRLKLRPRLRLGRYHSTSLIFDLLFNLDETLQGVNTNFI